MKFFLDFFFLLKALKQLRNNLLNFFSSTTQFIFIAIILTTPIFPTELLLVSSINVLKLRVRWLHETRLYILEPELKMKFVKL